VSRFTKKPLRILDNLYEFVGGLAGLSEFELSGAIQPVHDLSREAELAGFGQREGYWTVATSQVHAGAGELTDALTPYAQGTDLGNGWINPLPANWRIWVIDLWAYIVSAGAANLTAVQVVLSYPVQMVGPNDNNVVANERLLFHADTASSIQGGTNTMIRQAGEPSIVAQLPARIELAQNISFQSEASGACTINQFALIWVGEKGTYPAGMG